jgi:cytochrome c6
LDVLWALLLIGVAIFLGGILFRRVPAAYLVFGAVLVAFGFGIPALVTDDNRASTGGGGGGGATAAAPSGGESGQPSGGGGQTSGGGGGSGGGNAANAQGKQIFTQSCGTCHTLADAGTNGKIGPVLDQIKPDEKRVEKAIKIGGTGSGTMPSNLVQGKEAKAVAKYVSSVAGK